MGMEHIDRDKAAKALQEARKRHSNAVNTKGRAGDRRKPGEIRNRGDSIKSFCSECITSYGLDTGGAGGTQAAIRACASTECHLYPWRLGKLDDSV